VQVCNSPKRLTAHSLSLIKKDAIMKSYGMLVLCLIVSFQLNAQWTQMTAPSGSGITYNTFCATESAFLVGTNGLGIHKSTDNGLSWAKIPNATIEGSTQAIYLAGNSIYLGMYSTGPSVSTDNGATWNTIANGIVNKSIYAFGTMGRYLFASGASFYRSTDQGTNWTAAGTGLPTSTSTKKNGIIVMGNTVLVCALGSGIYRSTDSGATFSIYNGNLPFAYPKSILQKGSKIFLVNGSEVLVSTDTCTTWTSASTGTPSGMEPLAMYTDGSNIYIGTYGNGIYFTTNDGGQWQAANSGLTNLNVRGMIVRGTYIFAGTDAAIWRRPVIDLATSVQEESNNLPGRISLAQNYPNPFNPSTTISYQLSAVSNVKLNVYDVLGREICVLVNEIKQPGAHSTVWDAANMPSGVYFLKLTAGNYTQIRKMSLMK
jgi:hypothetical protein